MITIELNEENYEYDIHSLVKAFYPGEDLLVKVNPGEPMPACLFHLKVLYSPDHIDISFWQNNDPTPAMAETIAVYYADRLDTKNRLKQKLYQMLCEFSGQTLPWGSLTGIRPTKIPMAMLEEGKSDEDIREYMRQTYFCTDEKIDLSIEVAKREKELLSRIDYEDGYSLYIGIPFCPSTCLYCSFTSYPLAKWASRMDEYLDALEKEIDFTAETFQDKYLNSIYIGGGTPTTLEPAQLDRLITKIGTSFSLFDKENKIVYGGLPGQTDESNPTNHLLEFTVEGGRPDSITREKLQVLLDHNISRISINPQTMKEDTLRLIGRRHTVQQTIDAFKLAREMGFDNINMDLIVGLPEETIDDVRSTMESLMELGPDNVTVHSLAVKRAARLNIQREDYSNLHIENTWQTIGLTADYCRKMGLSPYYLYRQKNMAGNFENVGYAAPGKAGVYNILIMEEKQTIMALGAGATTKVVFNGGKRIERVGNVKDIYNYLERTDEMIDRKRNLITKIESGEIV